MVRLCNPEKKALWAIHLGYWSTQFLGGRLPGAGMLVGTLEPRVIAGARAPPSDIVLQRSLQENQILSWSRQGLQEGTYAREVRRVWFLFLYLLPGRA